MSRPADTSPDAHAAQTEALRRLSGAERLRLAFELSEYTRQLALAGLRERMEGASEAELVRELIRLRHGIRLEDR